MEGIMKKLLILAMLALTTVTASASYNNYYNKPEYDAGYSRGVVAGQQGSYQSQVYTENMYYNNGYSDGYEDGQQARNARYGNNW